MPKATREITTIPLPVEARTASAIPDMSGGEQALRAFALRLVCGDGPVASITEALGCCQAADLLVSYVQTGQADIGRLAPRGRVN